MYHIFIFLLSMLCYVLFYKICLNLCISFILFLLKTLSLNSSVSYTNVMFEGFQGGLHATVVKFPIWTTLNNNKTECIIFLSSFSYLYILLKPLGIINSLYHTPIKDLDNITPLNPSVQLNHRPIKSLHNITPVNPWDACCVKFLLCKISVV